MKKIIYLMLSLFLACPVIDANNTIIGSNSEAQTFAVLELDGNGTKGLRLPKMTESQRDVMAASKVFQDEKTGKAKGLIIFNSSTNQIEYWNGTAWVLF